MIVRRIEPTEIPAAGALLCEVTGRAAAARGFAAPWRSPAEAGAAIAHYRDADPTGSLVADDDGELVGVGFARRRGEVATIGPLAVARAGGGIGSAILDELIARAEAWGCSAIRLYQDAWNPDSFAFCAGRSFAAVDVVAVVERAGGRPPPQAGSRGLEIAPFRPEDLGEVAAMDERLTGLSRLADLASGVRLVARRRGALIGFLGSAASVPGRPEAEGALVLGPAMALDAADLGALLARGLGDGARPARARLSTASPVALPVTLGLGFRVVEIGTVLSRGVQPQARPPQLYSTLPEVL